MEGLDAFAHAPQLLPGFGRGYYDNKPSYGAVCLLSWHPVWHLSWHPACHLSWHPDHIVAPTLALPLTLPLICRG